MILLAISDIFTFQKIKIISKSKYYKILDTDDIGYYVKNDNGKNGWIIKDCFESFNDSRERKLNNII